MAGLETVSLAIGQGMRAASAIEDYIEGNKESELSQPPVVYSRELNTYYYQLGRDMGIDAIHDFMKPFGFGQLTGIDLNNEKTGVLPSTEWKRNRFKTPQPQILRMELPSLSNIISSSIKESALSYEESTEPTLLTRIKVAEGVEMTIESGTYRLSPARLRKLQRAVRDVLGPGFSSAGQSEEVDEEEDDEENR